ncbi:PqqD family protein [Candidatus Roizmanbacteria bacterium]|jgi:hypothetical protein|nr:PqqD family protein [Candidatus Roizmanbacteria bacterium]
MKNILKSRPIRRSKIAGRSLLERMEKDDSILLTNTVSHKMFLLNSFSAEIWMLCDGNITTEEIIKKISKKYDLKKETVEAKICFFLDNFLKNDLIDLI